ncbi:SANT and BTB domain regulator of class switch recombination-like isoform X2 [Babylonia areolata]|uniref:SANT and BTB domain regulator of class switch recombination-like isoform X2 n=1 Tax=Babylonia areolata TaxID=304850 RepID=UPI003FD1A94D
MTSVEPSSRIGVTLDLILKTLIASPDFNRLNSKNWDAIARLIPGTTPSQCARRYEELLASSGVATQQMAKAIIGSGGGGGSSSTILADVDTESRHSLSSAETAKQKDLKDGREPSTATGATGGGDSGEQGPMMVIHVCDEAKSLKKDFYCPRDLLVVEMKYFAEYLSTDTQRCEEVDISVHCDVQIFDWLIKYVKRGTKEVGEAPRLEANNVVSILISSDFLKMDSLVEECIQYCHRNMTAIVSTNCNMNCINDRLLQRITDLFTHNEADDIKDRKDKFKSKLFSKKLEKLFSSDYASADSPEDASTLFRCSVCHRLLTATLEKKVRCMPSRMTVDYRGHMSFSHVKDATFDINAHLIELKSQLKTWRDVYWRIWGTINSLPCSRCGEDFPLTEFGHCRYHPEPPRYDNNEPGSLMSCVGTYPCCHLMTVRFDPQQQNKGCRVKDHIISLSELPSSAGSSSKDAGKSAVHRLYDDLLARRDTICVPFQRLSDLSEETEEGSPSELEVDVFGNEVYASHCHMSVSTVPSLSQVGGQDDKTEPGRPPPSLQALTIEREVSNDDDEFGGSDDEVGDDEVQQGAGRRSRGGTKKSRVTIKQQAILLHAPVFEQTKKSVWDAQRSMRYNQDAQRQEDQRRIKDIRMYLAKLRLGSDKVERPKKEFAGGIFSKLDAQWRAAQAPVPSKQTGPSQFRAKPKPPNSVRSTMA